MTCDLILTRDGWVMQCDGQVTTMHATTEADAISEAHTHGYDQFAIWIDKKHRKDVFIPKRPIP